MKMENREDDRMEALMKNRTLFHFHELCQIPRESGKEEKVSNFIREWAETSGFETMQDGLFNLVIKKPGQGRNKDSEPLLLQAHLDMVCVKAPESEHDFEQDGIDWNIEGDWICSSSQTSLGADCGIGAALIMAVLEDRSLSHPPLEVLFTVCEETDMSGAWKIEPEYFAARRMINLDVSPDDKLLVGSCGGMALEVEVPLERESKDLHAEPLWLELGGLTGGHSGADIHRGRGNAITLVLGLLRRLQSEKMDFSLVELSGGNSRLAIPRDARAMVLCNAGSIGRIEEICDKYFEELQEAYEAGDPGLYLRIEKGKKSRYRAIKQESFERLLCAGWLLPVGIQEMSSELPGRVESSSNLGIAKTGEDGIIYIEEIRSIYPCTRRRIAAKGSLIAEMVGGRANIHSEYPEWRYRAHSSLRKTVLDTYRRRYQAEMETFTSHAGNEIGILSKRLGLEDAVAMGPSRYDYHTSKERLSISSSIKFEEFLKEILSEME